MALKKTSSASWNIGQQILPFCRSTSLAINLVPNNRGFALQPCCMAGTIDSFSYGKKCSFLCKKFSLFLPCKMAAVQNLYRLTETCSLGLPCTSLILDIHVMINWHLSKQGICCAVSHDYIAGSSLQLIEVTFFFKLTADQVLVFDWIMGSWSQLTLAQD